MRKKGIITAVAVVIAAIAVTISIYHLTSPKALGNMSHSYSEQTTMSPEISFAGKAGDRIKFSLKSNTESGDLDIILYDSEGNEVYKLDGAKELETFFDLSNSDTYTLAAECGSFIGKFEIKVHKV